MRRLNTYLSCIACCLILTFSSSLFAQPAYLESGQLVVPNLETEDFGNVEVRFDVDTADGIRITMADFGPVQAGSVESTSNLTSTFPKSSVSRFGTTS